MEIAVSGSPSDHDKKRKLEDLEANAPEPLNGTDSDSKAEPENQEKVEEADESELKRPRLEGNENNGGKLDGPGIFRLPDTDYFDLVIWAFSNVVITYIPVLIFLGFIFNCYSSKYNLILAILLLSTFFFLFLFTLDIFKAGFFHFINLVSGRKFEYEDKQENNFSFVVK